MASTRTGIRLLTEKDLAAALQMKPQSLADWRHRGQGPRYVKMGQLVRYRISDVQEWLDTRVTGGAQ